MAMTDQDKPIAKVATSGDRSKWPTCDRCKNPSASVQKGVLSKSDQFLCGTCELEDWNKERQGSTAP